MPSFKCESCGKKFNSKKKRELHMKKVHGKTGEGKKHGRPHIFTKKRVAAFMAGVLMVGLMFGGVIFWADMGDEGQGQNDFLENPPTGIGRVVEEGEVPNNYILDSPMSKEQQVFLLLHGGTQEFDGVSPSTILQYSCEDCPETVTELESIAESFNSNHRYVYVAPYYDMDYEVALTGFQQLTTYEEVNSTEIEEDICTKMGNQPVKCIEDVFN